MAQKKKAICPPVPDWFSAKWRPTYFCVYDKQAEALASLDDAQLGRLFRYMLNYMRDRSTAANLSGVEALAFGFIRGTMDEDFNHGIQRSWQLYFASHSREGMGDPTKPPQLSDDGHTMSDDVHTMSDDVHTMSDDNHQTSKEVYHNTGTHNTRTHNTRTQEHITQNNKTSSTRNTAGGGDDDDDNNFPLPTANNSTTAAPIKKGGDQLPTLSEIEAYIEAEGIGDFVDAGDMLERVHTLNTPQAWRRYVRKVAEGRKADRETTAPDPQRIPQNIYQDLPPAEN